MTDLVGTPRTGFRDAERDAKAAELRADGYTYTQIGTELGISATAASNAVRRAYRAVISEPVEALRGAELAKLDRGEAEVLRVLNTTHYTVSASGKLVAGPDGLPLIDPMPKLQAIDRLVRLAERRAKLLHLDKRGVMRDLSKMSMGELDALVAEIHSLRTPEWIADQDERLRKLIFRVDAMGDDQAHDDPRAIRAIEPGRPDPPAPDAGVKP